MTSVSPLLCAFLAQPLGSFTEKGPRAGREPGGLNSFHHGVGSPSTVAAASESLCPTPPLPQHCRAQAAPCPLILVLELKAHLAQNHWWGLRPPKHC